MDNRAYVDDDGPHLHNGLQDKTVKNGFVSPNDKEFDEMELTKHADIDIEYEDPWKVTSISQTYTPWNELTPAEKVLRVLGYFIKIVLVIGLLYMFICSLDFLGSAFKLLGGETAGRVFRRSDIMANPVAGLMMGVLVTVLVQSSSTSTSIIVSMVAADILTIKRAIPIVMGANIGTSVTNTIVALGQITDKGEFRRAFAGATVHDMFNWLAVLVLLPIEIITGYLYYLTKAIVKSFHLETQEGANRELLKKITKPFTSLIIQVDKKAITAIAKGDTSKYLDKDHMIMKVCCDKKKPVDCCKKTYEDSVLHHYNETFSAAKKTEFCTELEETCKIGVGRNITQSCVNNAWKYKEQKSDLNLVNCTMFGGSTDEEACCTGLGMLSLDQTSKDACEEIASCFNMTSTLSSFSMSTCQNDAIFENGTVTYKGDSFSCDVYTRDVADLTCYNECDFLFKGLYPELNDKEIGGILLVISLAILCICLVAIVKLLHSLLKGPMAIIIKKFINADFPGPCSYFTGYLAILVGAGLTILVQSSSIFTSTLTPLVGIGVIEIERMYPLTLGSNIGTTTTAILAALAGDGGSKMIAPLQVALCHLFFNISGILLFYPIIYLRFPLPLAKFLGNVTAKYRWFAVVYIILMFLVFPALVFALSIPGWYVLLAVLGPVAVVVIIIAIIKCFQAKRPQVLPAKLQNWKFLPKPMRSLEPYDKTMRKVFMCNRFQGNEDDGAAQTINTRL